MSLSGTGDLFPMGRGMGSLGDLHGIPPPLNGRKDKEEEKEPEYDSRFEKRKRDQSGWLMERVEPEPTSPVGVANEEEGREIRILGGGTRKLRKGERVQHYNDVHGIQLEDIRKLDKKVSGMRYRADDNTLTRVNHMVLSYARQRGLSPRQMAEALYKAKFKAIWMLPRSPNERSNLNYRIQVCSEQSYLENARLVCNGTGSLDSCQDVIALLSTDLVPASDGQMERRLTEMDSAKGWDLDIKASAGPRNSHHHQGKTRGRFNND